MFPTPEKVPIAGLDASNAKLDQSSKHLIQKLQDGEDCADEVMGYCVSGGPPSEGLLWASLGNRLADKKGCPMSLLCLLTMKADANSKHSQIGPALCWAARNDNKDIVEKLLDNGADLEALDPDNSPALKAAIVAGAAGVAIELVRRGANVHWKHHDGANYLHIITSWLTDGMAAEMNRRIPPKGEEPSKLVDMLIHHGVDPTAKQRWEGKGLSALDTWRARKDTSPWLEDERTFRDFEKTAKAIHKTLVKTADAMDQKASANKYLKEKKHKDACEGYARARDTLSQAGIDGHHMAALWSNEAICRLQMDDIEGARNACQEGMKLFCMDDLKEKLKFNLDKCDKASNPEAKVEEGPKVVQADVERLKPSRTALEKGFLGNAKGDLYGPEGSKQGCMPQYYQQPINGGEAVINVPINQQNCAQMNLIPMPEIPDPLDEEAEEAAKATFAKDC